MFISTPAVPVASLPWCWPRNGAVRAPPRRPGLQKSNSWPAFSNVKSVMQHLGSLNCKVQETNWFQVLNWKRKEWEMQQYQGNKECFLKKCSRSKHIAIIYFVSPIYLKYENKDKSCNSVSGLWQLCKVECHQETEMKLVLLCALS